MPFLFSACAMSDLPSNRAIIFAVNSRCYANHIPKAECPYWINLMGIDGRHCIYMFPPGEEVLVSKKPLCLFLMHDLRLGASKSGEFWSPIQMQISQHVRFLDRRMNQDR